MIDEKAVSIVRSVLNKHLAGDTYQTFIFGSRVDNSHRRYSDLDIGILGKSPLSASTILQIEEDLQDSDLAYLVDVVDFCTVSEKFKNAALSHSISI